MRKKLLSILALLCLTVSGAWAQNVIASGNCGPSGNESAVTWELTGTAGDYTLTISGSGAMADYTSNIVDRFPEPNPAPWFDYYLSIKRIEIGEGVTHIGNYAFWDCFLDKGVTISNTVTTIGTCAFSECTNLPSVEIPTSVTSIGDGAFSACSKLESITIPASVTSIGSQVFNSCHKLTSITVDPNNTVYDSRNSCNAIIHKSSNTLIEACNGTTTIPNTVTTIGESAFLGCRELESITIPNSVTTIGTGAFSGCYNSNNDTGLTSVTIGSGVTYIGQGAFAMCSNLNTITLNSNPYIGFFAFMFIKNDAVVTMNLTANAASGAYWMTFNNENYSFTPDANTTAYKGVLNGSNVQLEPVADVLADNAVILKSTSSAVTLTLTTSPTTTSDDFTGNALTSVKWTAENWNTPANCYTLSRGSSGEGTLGFYKYSGSTLNYGKAYLITPNAAPNFIGFNEGGATAIEVPAATNNVEKGEIYDLTGRRIESQPAKKGIYVKNGQKFIVK